MNQNKSQTRINQEIRNMLKQNLSYLKAAPLENDIYTWHFTIQGPQNSDFHQGLYHGQILLPFQYPFKPPDMIFMNKNGRFQVNTKICLTITQYHPEDWNPSWTIRTMLQAVISLFNEKVIGIGYEQGSKQMRQSLAIKSHHFKCDKCGILKDILTPREPMKEQEKKEDKNQRDQQKNQTIQKQNLDYIHEMLRRVKTEDISKNQGNKRAEESRIKKQEQKVQKQDKDKKSFEKKEKKRQEPVRSKVPIKESYKNQSNKQQNIKDQSKYKIRVLQTDNLALDKKIQRNYLTMLNVFKSIKMVALN